MSVFEKPYYKVLARAEKAEAANISLQAKYDDLEQVEIQSSQVISSQREVLDRQQVDLVTILLALETAKVTIEKLAEQQAISDDWWKLIVTNIKKVLAADYSGDKLLTVIDSIRKPTFILCNSGPNKRYEVVIKFEVLKDAQAFYRAIINLRQ